MGRVGTIKIFNPPFPVLKAGHSVSYSYICDVCREWVNEVGFFLKISVRLVCYAHVFHVHVHVGLQITGDSVTHSSSDAIAAYKSTKVWGMLTFPIYMYLITITQDQFTTL